MFNKNYDVAVLYRCCFLLLVLTICLHVNDLVFRNMSIVVCTFYDYHFMHITSYFYCIQVVISCGSHFCVISAFVGDN